MGQEKPRLHPLPHRTTLLAKLVEEGNSGVLGSELKVEEELLSEEKERDLQSL